MSHLTNEKNRPRFHIPGRLGTLCTCAIMHHAVCIYSTFSVEFLRKEDNAIADDSNGRKNKNVLKSAGFGQKIEGFFSLFVCEKDK